MPGISLTNALINAPLISLARHPVPALLPRGPSRCRWLSPVKAVLRTPETTEQRECLCSDSQCRPTLAAALAAVPILLTTTFAAAADEDSTVDAAFAAASQSIGATDLLVSVLAAIVFALLVVVTGGVGYLTLKSWLDDRQETQDRKAPAASSVAAASNSSVSDSEESGPRRVRVTRDKSRGFGNN